MCRPAAGTCDLAERCNGVADTCPADGFKPATAECGPGGDPCLAGGMCPGTGIACQAAEPKVGLEALLCAFDRSLEQPACRGEAVPANAAGLFARARGLAERTVGAETRTRKRALQQATVLLRRADKAVARAAKRKRQPISADCAGALHDMFGDALARVGAAKS